MPFRDCVQNALNDGVIDRYEAEDLVQRWERLEAAERAGAEAPGFARAELERQLTEEGKEAKRRKLLQTRAAMTARHDIHRFAQEQGPDVGEAVYRMFEHYGFTGFPSMRGIMNSLIGGAQAEMEAAIHAFERSGLTLQRRGLALMDAAVDAAFGSSNDPGAQALYRAWLAPTEKLRGLFNEAGGNIGWLERWGLPMAHDGGAVHAAGFQKWRDFIAPLLNWDEMQHGVTKAPILPAEREDVLRHVWESIATDGWNTRDPAAPDFPAKYRQRQDHRFLIFKDATSWRDYNRAYGAGDIWATMTAHIRSMARDVALMQRFGPNPTTTIEWLKHVVMSEAMKQKVDKPNLFEPGLTGRYKSLEGAAAAQQKMIDALYSIARGDSGAAPGLLADVGASFRNLQYSAKLGGAVINELTSGPVIQAFTRHLHGIPLTTQVMDLAKGFSGTGAQEATRAGLIVEDMLHVLEGGAREAAASSRLRRLSGWLPKATLQWSGLEPLTQAGRRAFLFGAMGHFGDMVEKSWAELPEKTRRLLAGYGLRRDEWAAIRLAEKYAPEGSAPFLRFAEIEQVGQTRPADLAALGVGVDEAGAQTHMHEIAMRYLAMLQGETERAVPQSAWRLRAAIDATIGIGREDTLWGQASRSFMMFKGFTGSFMFSHLQAVKQEIARDRAEGAAAAGAYLIMLTLGSLLATQLRSIAAGKDPRSIDPATKEGRATWGHALLNSGGLGIYGDFLSSDRSSYGHGQLETLAGPVVTGGLDFLNPIAGINELMEGKKPASTRVVDALRNNTPVLSTHWALRAAYNRVLLDQLQYLGDPHAHDAWRKAEDRLRRETGQGYWWGRGEVAPGRAPAMAR